MKASPTKLWIAGHRGLVGSSLVRYLQNSPKYQLILRTRAQLDLTDSFAVKEFYKTERPQAVIMAAAKVGGILANANHQIDFLSENLQIQNNVIRGALDHGCEKFLFLGSSCVYPKFAEQPIRESSLLTSSLEPTNEGYALAKITGLKLCEYIYRYAKRDFISAMPTNLYGPFDNFDPVGSHVIPGLIRKMHDAKVSGQATVTLWGTGTPLREFLHVDDLAKALVHLLENYSAPEWINVGSQEEHSIRELAEMVREVVGFKGDLVWDSTKPDGTPRKLMDSSKIFSTGWRPSYNLRSGLQHTYTWFLENQNQVVHRSGASVEK